MLSPQQPGDLNPQAIAAILRTQKQRIDLVLRAAGHHIPTDAANPHRPRTLRLRVPARTQQSWQQPSLSTSPGNNGSVATPPRLLVSPERRGASPAFEKCVTPYQTSALAARRAFRASPSWLSEQASPSLPRSPSFHTPMDGSPARRWRHAATRSPCSMRAFDSRSPGEVMLSPRHSIRAII